ncbi:MAG TPA: hypothetical protein VIA18_08570, partial [Polyangia bacterium]|nr:hypothetical protein [Polyangia bacterium]
MLRHPTSSPKLLRALAFAGALAVAATDSAAEPPAAPVDVKKIYDVLGGKPGIVSLVDDFVGRALKDERVRHRFDRSNVAHFKAMLVDQVCERLGGPCKYTGQDMRTAHIGMHISDAEYDALTEDFRAALATRHMPEDLQKQLLALRDHQRADIVEPHVERPAATGDASAATLRRAQDLHDAAKLLELADSARTRGSQSLAAQLFYAAELAVGSEALADLEPIYRTSAPPRVHSPVVAAAPEPPQPRVAGAAAAPEESPPRPVEPARPSLSGTLTAGKGAAPGVAYVTLTPVDGRPPRAPAPQHRTMEQRGRDFAPHLLVVPVGSTVSFPNFDPVYHNVYSASAAKPFDLGVYKSGQSRDVTFDRAGLVRVQCNVHENMGAYIAVVAAPYATVADGGRFSFHALPAGRYKLRAWSERSGKTTEQEIALHAGKNE